MQATSNVEDRTDYEGGTVRVEPAGIDIDVEPEETLMEAADRLGYDWPTGEKLCSDMADQEEETLANNDRPDGARLACQLLVNGDVTVYREGAPHLPPG